jgi:hypothetical protein
MLVCTRCERISTRTDYCPFCKKYTLVWAPSKRDIRKDCRRINKIRSESMLKDNREDKYCDEQSNFERYLRRMKRGTGTLV